MAIMTNNNVATILLTESLLIPQTPCPEVHPLPSFVPKPTKNPPTIIKGIDLVISKLALLISKYIDGPMINPNKNKIASVNGWIVDTSLEHDHELFSGFLKVSIEEILIALHDDSHFLNNSESFSCMRLGRLHGCKSNCREEALK